jgi:hypothetical protein
MPCTAEDSGSSALVYKTTIAVGAKGWQRVVRADGTLRVSRPVTYIEATHNSDPLLNCHAQSLYELKPPC